MFRNKSISVVVLSCGLISGAAAFAQTAINPQTPLAATARSPVPALVPYSGVALDPDGKPVSAESSITFLIFTDENGGEPLWAETQSVRLSPTGHYKVELGAGTPSGLPQDLFSTGEARWLEVQVAGQTAQSRVLFASVPYSMKAGDSATLGGLPPSAFLKAEDLKTAVASATPLASTTTADAVTTTGGTAGFVPSFTGTSAIANSEIFDTGTSVGIGDQPNPAAKLDVNGATILRGGVQLSRTGNATTTAGANSYGFDFYTQAYNSSSKAAVNPFFQWQGEATGNNTSSPGATMNLLYSNGAGLAETGLYLNGDGTIHFAPGQIFQDMGTGTISGVTAGTDLTGGGTSGNITLNVDTTKVVTSVAAGTGLAGGGTGGKLTLAVDPTQVPLLNSSNTFAGKVIAGTSSSVGGILLQPSEVAFPSNAGSWGTQSNPLDIEASTKNLSGGSPVIQDFQWLAEPRFGTNSAPSGSLNLLYGAGGAPQETGIIFSPAGGITAQSLAVSQPEGTVNTPVLTLTADDDGVARGTARQLLIQGAANSAQQLMIGYVSDSATDENGGFASVQATWTGVRNTPLMLQPNGGCVCISTGNTAPYSNPLIVGQGAGSAVADGWSTYSSRRFKTDIQTLTGALDKVEQMRGVSYTLKATGKREIGVIAEEVGAVVPEAVTWETNGKDAQSVDYNRLTALLIQATKEQQAEIAKQGEELRAAIHKIHRQAAAIRTLELKAQATAQGQAKVKAFTQGFSAQPSSPVLVALK